MKKSFIVILLLFALALTACGASNVTQTNTTAVNNNGNNNSFGNAALPLATQLMLGTFKLEGTDKAVTAEEAAQLLPLWEVYKDLSASSSAAQQEADQLAEQIQETMTPEQVLAITDMKLTRRDMFQTMQDLGLVPAGGGPTASGTPRPGGGQGGNFQGGGNGSGGPGGNGFGGGNGGGGQGFNGQNLSPQQIATFQARREQNGGQSNQISPALYDALIKLLQSKK